MIMMRARFGVAALMLAASAATAAGQGRVETANDLVYTKVGDTELKLDLARPADGAGPFPAVLVIHGGGWKGGDKKDSRPVLTQLAQRGYVAISPQYRFSQAAPFPAQVQDVKAAVRWLKGHAGEYKVDPTRVGAMGFSAGGHLALLLGVTGPEDGLEGEAPAGAADTKVRAVVNYFGPTDLGASDIPTPVLPLVHDLLGGSAADRPAAARKASPLTYVSKGDAAILTFQGTKDALVPYTQAIKLGEAQSATGVPGRVELLIGAGHGWGDAELTRTLDESWAFFDRHLKN